MTLEQIYYIGQTIAALAILGSLIAIYWQQRKTHALERAASQREILASVKELSGFPATDPTALESIRVCFQDYSGATPFQQAQFAHAAIMAVNIAEKALYMKRDDLFDHNSADSFVEVALAYIATPGGRQWWANVGHMFGAIVRDEIEHNLKERDDIVPLWELLIYYGSAEVEAANARTSPEEPLQ
ncbi:MAG: hypothetical protein AAF251_11710 [Pseudomonadota bacterium]